MASWLNFSPVYYIFLFSSFFFSSFKSSFSFVIRKMIRQKRNKCLKKKSIRNEFWICFLCFVLQRISILWDFEIKLPFIEIGFICGSHAGKNNHPKSNIRANLNISFSLQTQIEFNDDYVLLACFPQSLAPA